MNRPIYVVILFLLLSASMGVTARISTEPILDGSITGRVILEDGTPAEEAQIDLGRSGMYASTWRSIKTDSEGNFKVTGLVPGLYELEATLPGYVTAPGSPESALYRIGDHVTINMVKGGVITGAVTDENGEPLTGVAVYSRRVRDAEGRAIIGADRETSWGRFTDDRGVYRLFELNPGSYIIQVDVQTDIQGTNDAPTYYPSATRESATEVTVHAGEEVSGINIQLRGYRGSAITGVLSSEIEEGNIQDSASVGLYNKTGEQIEGFTSTYNSNNFVLFGVPDGDYILIAHGNGILGSPHHIQVRGADITGIVLKLFKYSSIGGRVSFEEAKTSSTPCLSKEKFQFEEIFLDAKSDEPKRPFLNPFFHSNTYWATSRRSVLSEKGEFTLENLEPGRYRIVSNLPGENWYIRSIDLPAPRATKGATKGLIDASRAGIAVKRGEKISGVEVIIADGAASLSGRLVLANDPPAKTTRTPLSRYRIHLVPGESAAAENALRYGETRAGSDGSFAFKNLAPGKYWLLARPLPDDESTETETRPAAWDASERAKLRREAENLKNAVEIQPCQRFNDYILRIK
jgi:protocatechuate 3,4-dioxygenase beta subunit